MKTLSFIIPVYNGEKYISRCLRSIFHQSYPDLEIIIVNDGSTDNSLEVIKNTISLYNKNGCNTIILNQNNAGVSCARNEGINRASSDYIAFLDQDDYIHPDFCNLFMSEVEASDYDMVIGGFIRKNSSGKTTRKLKANNHPWSKYCLTYPWARIIRREFLNEHNIRFAKTSIGEDVYFDLVAYSYTDLIRMIPYCLYVWSDIPSSVSNVNYTFINKETNPIHTFDMILRDKNNSNIVFRDFEEYYFIKFIVWYLLTNVRNSHKDDIIKTRKELFLWLKNHYPDFIHNKNISLFKPKGDLLKNRIAVYVYILLYRINLDSCMLKLLSK